MICYLSPILLVISSMNFQQVFSTECVEVNHPIIRTFSSLVDFEGNKIPFDPRNSSIGNYVAFNFIEIESLPRNAFLTFDSEHIIKLDLSGKNTKEIKDGAFSSLTCLKYLSINNNSLSKLTWKTFKDVGNLVELNISTNKLKELPGMIFRDTPRLRYLDLSNNMLRKLSPFTFTNLTNLQKLNLSKNDFTFIETEVFDPLISLQVLDLSNNKFIELDYQNWKLRNLETLDLAGNYLRSFDTSLSSTFGNLKILNLSSNYLEYLNVHALKKNYYKLTTLDLNHNNWHCDDLAKIVHYLVDFRLQLPARNSSKINELGIDCNNYMPVTLGDVLETSIVTSSITPVKNASYSVKNVEIEFQIDDLANKNNEILLEITGVRKLLILSLMFFVLCVILYAMVQVGWCDGLKQKFGSREGYIEASAQENYSMLRS
ncbi:hypothetical protein WA026_017720 [Henosepilachna vigintioctopunctata]|uniref:Uncharacterized protein n=1 Tax=Henosepilachna vigintioctopunctata TaxID=420089 RepID=A0AAW1U9P7_9CUCU